MFYRIKRSTIQKTAEAKRLAEMRAHLENEIATASTAGTPAPDQPKRRRYGGLKRAAALVALVVAVAVIAGEQLAMVSANAVLNAQVTTLRAPITGRLRVEPRALGAPVRRGEVIATLANPRLDTTRLDDLMLERDTSQAALTQSEATLAAITRARTALLPAIATYSDARIAEAEARVTEAQESVQAATARVILARAEAGRADTLAAQGLRATAIAEERRTELAVATASQRIANQAEARAAIVLEAARAGVFLGDGFNDAPHSVQRREVLALERERIAAEAAFHRTQLGALQQRLDAEHLRVNARRAAVVGANVNGRLWMLSAADGEDVQAGQEIARLVDCTSTVVTLSVSESVYNRLSLGMPARFRAADDGRVFQGEILRLAGSGAREVYNHLAVAPSRLHLERYDVTLSVPELRRDPTLGCAIGRTGRAFFEERPFDWLRRLVQ
ncbi:MAG: HlyD family efflux transporter periplasmic adaptor subunit [Pseudomonadota bacterium]